MIKKTSLYTIFLVVLIDLIGFGIILPLLPFYATRYGASPVAIGFLYSIFSMAQLVFSPFWGALSDRVGRRPILMMSTLGSVAAYLLFAFSGSFGMIFFSRFLAGVMGGNIATAQAYVTDVTAEEERARGMGLIGAAFGIGFVLGPVLGVMLVWHPAGPGLGAAALSMVSFFLVLFKLPETITMDRAKKLSLKYEGVFTRVFWQKLQQNTPILFLGMFILAVAQASLYGAFPLYCQEVLRFTPQEVGMQFVYLGVVAVVIQGGLIQTLVKRFGEEVLFMLGSGLMAAGFFLIPFAVSKATLMVYLAVMAVGYSLNGPTLNSLISKRSGFVGAGAVMGVSQGMAGLGRMIGPTWGGLLYGFSYKLPFFATAVVSSALLAIGFKLYRQKRV